MKKMHIIGLVVIAIAIGVLITQAGDYDTYTNFTTAMTQTEKNHQIVGHLVLDDEKPVVYDPEVDANSFSFYMTDKDGVEKKVVCKSEKPQDFERSEQIVLTGKMEGDVFVAHDMQLKCPSKYQDEALQNSKEVVSK